jgi:hypothetical protein
MKRVIVCMPMNDEIRLIKAHLDVYKDIVDYFVISESVWTHSLNHKGLYLDNAFKSGMFTDEEMAKIVPVTLRKDHLSDGFVNEYAHTWLREPYPYTNVWRVGLELLLPGEDRVTFTVIKFDRTHIYVHDSLEKRTFDILPTLNSLNRSDIYIKRFHWTPGDHRCVAEGVQRNALDRGIMQLNSKISLNEDDILIILDTDEFIDPAFLTSMKLNTWVSTHPDEFTIPDGRTFKITHSRWDSTLPDCPPLRVMKPPPPNYGLPIPLCSEHLDTHYGVKLCLHWHIFTPKLRKTIEWGRRQETAILTTWGAYQTAKSHVGTFGKRMPCHYRRNTAPFPQIGPCGWHLSWLNPMEKLEAYAEWPKEKGILARKWMANCMSRTMDPTPIIFSETFNPDDDTKSFDRNDRTLIEIDDDPYMPDLLKQLK